MTIPDIDSQHPQRGFDRRSTGLRDVQEHRQPVPFGFPLQRRRRARRAFAQVQRAPLCFPRFTQRGAVFHLAARPVDARDESSADERARERPERHRARRTRRGMRRHPGCVFIRPQ